MEYDYPIKSENLTLPGTLQLPDSNNNKHILALFIHGSGPHDRDESYHDNRPFKDIAIGLAEHGIASYRFDKRTLVAPLLFINDDYTVDDEVCKDIIGIVNYFHSNDTFKTYKIILIGHSLGAMLIPRIADSIRDKINAAVMLAAPARSFQDILLEQVKYLYNLHPDEETVKKEEVKAFTTAIKYLDSDNFNVLSPKDSLPLHLPASYWLSLKNYDQITVAKRVLVPLLIIQGEHDYHVTMKDFELWKENLKDNKLVELKSYPKVNHFLFETEQMSVPEDYENKWRVASYLINDIAQWILRLR